MRSSPSAWADHHLTGRALAGPLAALLLAAGAFLPVTANPAATPQPQPASISALATDIAPSPALIEALAQAMAAEPDGGDRFDAQVWLLDMQSRLARRQPQAYPDRQARLSLLQRIHAEARRAALPPELVLALIDVESRFRPAARSPVGARGLMQVMPFWKAEIGRPQDDLEDVATNLRYGCTILAHYLSRENGDWTRALARYNGSLGRTTYPEQVMAAWYHYWWVKR
ncbi:lytic transglycosylase domain-containing protein [Salinicola endophyticus]|uniref:Lytic transglycosylase domain-containing protein n=1 Tax=Salinicola endophyticus TaxID=1949083 RepID=A0ABY8FKH3_9GAMM|nr:transglycosylase SLT domain-containing protein [Salinicola endophyticus]WFF43047.1 lytic transglycosylase domain-containing protein [Salinicola endophyticus]